MAPSAPLISSPITYLWPIISKRLRMLLWKSRSSSEKITADINILGTTIKKPVHHSLSSVSFRAYFKCPTFPKAFLKPECDHPLSRAHSTGPESLLPSSVLKTLLSCPILSTKRLTSSRQELWLSHLPLLAPILTLPYPMGIKK